MSLSGIAVEPCGILAILFSFSFFSGELLPNLLKWNHAGLDWHRTKRFSAISILKFESAARRKTGG